MSEKRYTFKNLDLWRQAQDFAMEVIRVTEKLGDGRAADVVARQLIRSSTSIAANVAEGHGRFTVEAYRNHLSIAEGSATESESWLDSLQRLDFVASEDVLPLEKKCIALTFGLTRQSTALERQGVRISEESSGYVASPEMVPEFPCSMVRGLMAGDKEGGL